MNSKDFLVRKGSPDGSSSSPKAMQSYVCFVWRLCNDNKKGIKLTFVLQGAFGGSGGFRKRSPDGSPSGPKAMKSKDFLVRNCSPDGSPSSPKAMQSKVVLFLKKFCIQK